MNVINLWGAPGSGKSTTAAGLFFLMKINKYKVELVTEYAKDLVWDRHQSMLNNQISIFAEQNHRLHRLQSHGIDFVITDSPLPLPSFYKPKGYFSQFDPMVNEAFNSYNNLNYLLHRRGSFEAIGRVHDETESDAIAGELKTFLDQLGIECVELDANPQTPQAIFNDLVSRMAAPAVAMPLATAGDVPTPTNDWA